LPLKTGLVVPLSAVADVSVGTGRAAITRENGRRYIGVRMNVRNRDLGSFVKEAREKVGQSAERPRSLVQLRHQPVEFAIEFRIVAIGAVRRCHQTTRLCQCVLEVGCDRGQAREGWRCSGVASCPRMLVTGSPTY